MTQIKTSRQTPESNKNTGDEFTAVEFNEINDVINNNADDITTRVGELELQPASIDSSLSAIEGVATPIQSYATHLLPASADPGTIAYNENEGELVYFKNGSWHKISNNNEILIVSGLSFVIDTTLISTLNVHTGTSTNTEFTLPFVDGGVYNCTVDWNADNPGTDTQEVTTPGRILHDYGTPGQYRISISGVIEGFSFDDYTTTGNAHSDAIESANKVIELKSFGSLKYYGDSTVNTKAGDAFLQCRNMIITATDLPDTSQASDFWYMFRDCLALTNDVPLLDLSAGASFRGMFYGCKLITALPDLNFDNGVTRNTFALYETFRQCWSLPSLDNITFGDMGPNVRHLFRDCFALTNIPPTCDFSNVVDFAYSMRSCRSLTDFPQYNQLTNGTNFTDAWFDCALTAQAIENILSGLVANGRSNLTTSFAGGTNAGKSTWSATANAHYDTLVNTRGWIIAHNA